MNKPVYLDYNATTPTDPRVVERMTPYFSDHFGNAASRHHSLGTDAARAVEQARDEVAALIGADPREIVFTSGATESNNLAIKGIADSAVYQDRRRHIVTVTTEHSAVLDPCAYLESRGFEITRLSVDQYGCIDPTELESAVTPGTLLVSIMHANNETGVLHPIADLGRLCKERGVLFHTDATQSVGREAIDVEALGVDLLSLSAHKIYGPKGVGALYMRRRSPRVRCEPLQHGGGHERGVRSGTLNVPGIVGLGAAAAICKKEMAAECGRVRHLRDEFESNLVARIPIARRNGHPERRLANTANVSLVGLDAGELMKSMPDIAASSASACTSASMQPSYVLRAMGAQAEVVRGSVRFSLGRFTTEEEIRYALRTVEDAVKAFAASHGSQGSECQSDDSPIC